MKCRKAWELDCWSLSFVFGIKPMLSENELPEGFKSESAEMSPKSVLEEVSPKGLCCFERENELLREFWFAGFSIDKPFKFRKQSFRSSLLISTLQNIDQCYTRIWLEWHIFYQMT